MSSGDLSFATMKVRSGPRSKYADFLNCSSPCACGNASMKSCSLLKRKISIGNCLGGTLPKACENTATRFSKSEIRRRPLASFVSVNNRKCSEDISDHFASFAWSAGVPASRNKNTSAITRYRISQIVHLSPWERSAAARRLHEGLIEFCTSPYLLPEGEGKINSHEDQRNSAGLEDDSRGACSFFIDRNYEGVSIELPRLLCVRHRAPRRRHDAAAGQRL